MPSIHFKELRALLMARAAQDPKPDARDSFFEIRFDDPGGSAVVFDSGMVNKVITTECPYGSVVIQWDTTGQLKSLDIS